MAFTVRNYELMSVTIYYYMISSCELSQSCIRNSMHKTVQTKPNIREIREKKCDPSHSDCGMIVGARQFGLSISEIADLGFSRTTVFRVYREKTEDEVEPEICSRQICSNSVRPLCPHGPGMFPAAQIIQIVLLAKWMVSG